MMLPLKVTDHIKLTAHASMFIGKHLDFSGTFWSHVLVCVSKNNSLMTGVLLHPILKLFYNSMVYICY